MKIVVYLPNKPIRNESVEVPATIGDGRQAVATVDVAEFTHQKVMTITLKENSQSKIETAQPRHTGQRVAADPRVREAASEIMGGRMLSYEMAAREIGIHPTTFRNYMAAKNEKNGWKIQNSVREWVNKQRPDGADPL